MKQCSPDVLKCSVSCREFNQSDHPASPVVMNLEIKVPKGVILELLFIQCLHRNCMVSKQEYKC